MDAPLGFVYYLGNERFDRREKMTFLKKIIYGVPLLILYKKIKFDLPLVTEWGMISMAF